jgi:hypothetical protein
MKTTTQAIDAAISAAQKRTRKEGGQVKPRGEHDCMILKSERVRLARAGFNRLDIARQMLALKGVIDHWPLWLKHGTIGNSRTFSLPLP